MAQVFEDVAFFPGERVLPSKADGPGYVSVPLQQEIRAVTKVVAPKNIGYGPWMC